MSDHIRVVITHPHDGHAPNETCLDCQAAGRVRSKARQAAEERYPSYPVVGFSGAEDRQVAFLEGVAWALPENPDPAVIEAMAKALYNPVNNKSMIRWAHFMDRDKDGYRRLARAAYAAMRGAMQ